MNNKPEQIKTPVEKMANFAVLNILRLQNIINQKDLEIQQLKEKLQNN